MILKEVDTPFGRIKRLFGIMIINFFFFNLIT